MGPSNPASAKRHNARVSPGAQARNPALAGAVAALRRGREAIVEMDGHLDEALGWLANPRQPPRFDLPDRMAVTRKRASAALAALGGPASSELF